MTRVFHPRDDLEPLAYPYRCVLKPYSISASANKQNTGHHSSLDPVSLISNVISKLTIPNSITTEVDTCRGSLTRHYVDILGALKTC